MEQSCSIPWSWTPNKIRVRGGEGGGGGGGGGGVGGLQAEAEKDILES